MFGIDFLSLALFSRVFIMYCISCSLDCAVGAPNHIHIESIADEINDDDDRHRTNTARFIGTITASGQHQDE